MKVESHVRAKKLLVADRVEGIAAGERLWLEAHLSACNECSNEAAALSAAIDSVRTFSVTAQPDAVRRTRLALYRRAGQLREERERAAPLWIAVAISSVWAIVTAPFLWSAFAWFGSSLRLSSAFWQLGFLMWWFLPATVLSGAACWRHVSRRVNWGTL